MKDTSHSEESQGRIQGHCNKFLCLQMTKGKAHTFVPKWPSNPSLLSSHAKCSKQKTKYLKSTTPYLEERWENIAVNCNATQKKIMWRDNVERGIWIGNVDRELEIQKFIHRLKKSQTGGQASSGFESCFYTCRSSGVRSWSPAAQLFSCSNTTCSIGNLF